MTGQFILRNSYEIGCVFEESGYSRATLHSDIIAFFRSKRFSEDFDPLDDSKLINEQRRMPVDSQAYRYIRTAYVYMRTKGMTGRELADLFESKHILDFIDDNRYALRVVSESDFIQYIDEYAGIAPDQGLLWRLQEIPNAPSIYLG